MTAMERAIEIAGANAELRDEIHRAIIEHSNAELERRRAVEARLRQARNVVQVILANAAPSGLDWGNSEIARLAKQALEVLEGRG